MPESETQSSDASAGKPFALNARNGVMLAVTIVVLGLLLRELVTAPIQKRVTLQNCLERYAAAKNSSDSTVINNLRFTDSSTGRRKMCGSLRQVTVIKL